MINSADEVFEQAREIIAKGVGFPGLGEVAPAAKKVGALGRRKQLKSAAQFAEKNPINNGKHFPGLGQKSGFPGL